ncbi:hypothetical protein PCASD_01239 [Puccinia coronata f. sp. avenae]|uniref:Integrase catalytic domain-containing protein n=1 Tax=Puccinia coronata f. sp. avenae TaxID=200324 RepID=A0A2N5VJ65_9BASI|nr:hypothetical protein PCASD_01239 [Puccinia coronata f. sp. avenae]
MEKQSGHMLKKLVSDGGSKFVKRELSAVFEAAGVKNIVLPPYTLQHNGFAKRANQTVIEMTRTMLIRANMVLAWWGDAVRTATATTNCLPTLSKLKLWPLELMFKVKPKMDFFQPFGCRAWAVKPKQNRDTKFSTIAWEGVLLEEECIPTSASVYFNEDNFPECPAVGRTSTPRGINKLPLFVVSDPLPYAADTESQGDEQAEADDQAELAKIATITDRLAALRKAGKTPCPTIAVNVEDEVIVARERVNPDHAAKHITSNISLANI